MQARALLTLAALVTTAVGACVVGDVDVSGHPCPCPADYRCDAATQRCVAGAGAAANVGGGVVDGAGGAAGATDQGGTGGAGGAASPCGGVCGTPGCGACPQVPVIDAGGFGVDALEALRGDYARFLADAVDPATQDPWCDWNVDFAPSDVDDCAGYDLSQEGFPMTCVDWCDAAAFCRWAGKHLCGRIGGGTVPTGAEDDPEESEWYAACSAGGTKTYPYGHTYDTVACNTLGSGHGADVTGAGWSADCEGGYPGVFDMVGNAEEWEDACPPSADPAGDNCPLRGGAYWADDSTVDHDFAKCTLNASRAPDRNASSHDWGFRCCSGP